MASIFLRTDPTPPDWAAAGLRYYALGHYLRQQFGGRVWKLSVDAGLGCPNRDATSGSGGCVFCDPASFSPSRRMGRTSIAEQLADGMRRLKTRRRAERFLAYFQPGTNTYAPVDRLQAVYAEAIAQPGVVGLIVGTRPDCLPDDVLGLLADLSARTWLRVEFGLQSIHPRSLAWMNRGHGPDAFFDAVQRSRNHGLRVGAHLILGLPGEGRAEVQATAQQVARAGVESVKLHNLHAVRGTRLADLVAAGQVALPTLDEYAAMVVDFLEQLPAHCVIDRTSGDAPPDCLIAPAWCLDKVAVRKAIDAELLRRDTCQGRLFH